MHTKVFDRKPGKVNNIKYLKSEVRAQNMKKEDLTEIVGTKNVFDHPDVLDAYYKDHSFVTPRKPWLVVKVRNSDEVQRIVKWANKTNTPLVPISSGPPHFHGDTIPGLPGTIIIDLSGMKRIIRIDRRNRMTVVEPGITFSELQPELAKEGLKLSTPLLPRFSKSVVASLLEREPILIPKYHWSMAEPLRCLEVVWGNGERSLTGDAGIHEESLERQWEKGMAQSFGMGPFQIDYYRLIQGSQGTMGIVTWAAIKCEILPQLHKVFFVPSERLDNLVGFVYKLLRYRFGDELFLMNSSHLACILGEDPNGIKSLKEQLPQWVVIVGIAGRDRLPKEKAEFQERDILDIAQTYSLRPMPAIPGVYNGQMLDKLLLPSKDPYWKFRYKGECQDIFFLTTLNRTPEFVNTIYSLSQAKGYSMLDIGIYIQPVMQGVACHCEFNLPYNPGNPREVTKIKSFFVEASEALLKQGAYFSRPYGIWGDMVYNRDARSSMVLRKVKRIFDPNNVLNPGKLCFSA